jgi:serine/threonine protein kinase
MPDLPQRSPWKPDSLIRAGPVPVIPDHEVIRTIGEGSSGQVWLARNALGTFRAVKVVSRESFKHRRPFERELHGILKFEPVSRLHDGLVDILQVGGNAESDCFYYVMELADDVVAGPNIQPAAYQPKTLASVRRQHRRLPIAECVRLGAAIASALEFLHRQGLIHRDIKPSNIIFVNGAPKLADIGLVTDMFAPGVFVGTEGFIPPEGCGTVRSDIYSLGKVLYEISTGKDRNDYPELPDDLQNTADASALILLNKMILKACRARPWHRYQTAQEMMSDLQAFQSDKKRLHRRKRQRLLTRLIGIIGAIVALGVVLTMILRIIWLVRHGP